MKFETQLASAKVETPTTKTGNSTGEALAKLPKFVISKFCGNFQDWQRFWRQFIETVDKTSMPPPSQSLHICVSCSTLRQSTTLLRYPLLLRATTELVY